MKTKFHSLLVVLALLASGYQADAQGTAFTYQGRLTDNGASANSTYDFSFFLYDASSGGTQLSFVLRPGMVVSNGLFYRSAGLREQFPRRRPMARDQSWDEHFSSATKAYARALRQSRSRSLGGQRRIACRHFYSEHSLLHVHWQPHLRRLRRNSGGIPLLSSTPRLQLYLSARCRTRGSRPTSRAPIKSGSSTAMPERRTISSERLITRLSTSASTTHASCVNRLATDAEGTLHQRSECHRRIFGQFRSRHRW